MNQRQLNRQLFLSAERGNLEGIIQALRQGADIHASDDYALRLSAGRGHLEVVRYLLQDAKPPANIHAENDDALRWSAERGHLKVVKYLLQEANPPANIHANNDGALIMSAANGHLDIVRYLLQEAGADIHANNDDALMWSAGNGHLPVVRYLLQEANPPANNDTDWALILSAEGKKWDVATYLVWKGADINSIDPEQRNEVQHRLDDPSLIQDRQLRLDYKKSKGQLSLQELAYLKAERTGQLKVGVLPHLDVVSYPRSTSLKSRINHLLLHPITQSEHKLLISLLKIPAGG